MIKFAVLLACLTLVPAVIYGFGIVIDKLGMMYIRWRDRARHP